MENQMNKSSVTVQSIFNTAFERAKRGGWQPEETFFHALDADGISIPVDGILFNQAFARGIWGEEMVDDQGKSSRNAENATINVVWMPLWKYHLRTMVISGDPIGYLWENIQ